MLYIRAADNANENISVLVFHFTRELGKWKNFVSLGFLSFLPSLHPPFIMRLDSTRLDGLAGHSGSRRAKMLHHTLINFSYVIQRILLIRLRSAAGSEMRGKVL